MNDYQWPALITWLALLLQVALAYNVGRARVRYQVKAPATTGDPVFERYYRVQMNTLESAAVFVPALWLAAAYWRADYAAIVGAVWLAGRLWYAYAYVREPGRRGAGFLLAMFAASVLLVSAAIGWLRSWPA